MAFSRKPSGRHDDAQAMPLVPDLGPPPDLSRRDLGGGGHREASPVDTGPSPDRRRGRGRPRRSATPAERQVAAVLVAQLEGERVEADGLARREQRELARAGRRLGAIVIRLRATRAGSVAGAPGRTRHRRAPCSSASRRRGSRRSAGGGGADPDGGGDEPPGESLAPSRGAPTDRGDAPCMSDRHRTAAPAPRPRREAS